jgi:steroid delta-isomerase-like uncharacterized protein
MQPHTILVPLLAFVAPVLVGTAPALANPAQDASRAGSVAALPQIVADYGAAWSSGDPTRVAALYADDALFEEVVLGGGVAHNPDELRAYAGEVFAAFSSFALTPTTGFASGDRVAAEWVITGSYTGQFGELPPGTGQPVEFRGATFLELADGQIRRDSEYWDAATLLAQVGALPGAGTPTPGS